MEMRSRLKKKHINYGLKINFILCFKLKNVSVQLSKGIVILRITVTF